MKWSGGNITVRIDDKEDTYSPGAMEAEQYSDGAFSLKVTDDQGKYTVVVRMNKEELKELMRELLKTI